MITVVLRAIRYVVPLLAVAATISAGLACGAFRGEDGPSQPDASTESSTPDDAAPDADAGDACPVWFTESFPTQMLPPPEWTLDGKPKPELSISVTDTLPMGLKPPSSNALFARANLATDAGTVDLFTIGRSTVVKPSSIQLDYELLFTESSLYAELGCSMRLETGDTSPYARVLLRATGSTLGYEVNTEDYDAGPSANTAVPLGDLLVGVWMNVATRFDFATNGSAKATITISQNGQAPVVQTTSFIVPPTFDNLKIKCGVSYADNGPGAVGVAIDDVVARTCP